MVEARGGRSRCGLKRRTQKNGQTVRPFYPPPTAACSCTRSCTRSEGGARRATQRAGRGAGGGRPRSEEQQIGLTCFFRSAPSLLFCFLFSSTPAAGWGVGHTHARAVSIACPSLPPPPDVDPPPRARCGRGRRGRDRARRRSGPRVRGQRRPRGGRVRGVRERKRERLCFLSTTFHQPSTTHSLPLSTHRSSSARRPRAPPGRASARPR